MDKRNFYLEIFLISLASLLLEVSYTRVFSFKLFYFYTYLIIGLALLGLGSGAVLLTVVPRLKHASTSGLLSAGCTIAGALVGIGYVVIAVTSINTFELTKNVGQPLRFVGVSGLLFLVYLIVGILIAKLFASRPESINRLYAADLIGAALGCAMSIYLMRQITPPGCIYLSGAVFAGAGLRQARARSNASFLLGAVTSLILLGGAVFPDRLPDPVPDRIKTLDVTKADKNLFSKWDPVFRIDVTPTFTDDALIVNHDGLLGSTLLKFTGRIEAMTRFETDSRALPFAVATKPKQVLIIGAAGGHEILAALYFGSTNVTGVELNPATVSLLHQHFADYTGHLYRYPGVTYINGEGRSYLAGQDGRYDVIFFVAPDSYAAMNAASAGAFVLSESYLYTVGMIELSLRHLTDDGIICMQFGEIAFAQKPNRTSRYVATAREAFRRLGIDEFERHVLVSSGTDLFNPSTILLKRRPFTNEEIDRFLAASEKIPGNKAAYAPGRSLQQGPVTTIITLPESELASWYDSYRYDVRPVHDDSPFFWHFARFRDVLAPQTNNLIPDFEDSMGERLLLGLLAVGAGYALVFLLLPFAFIHRTWLELPFKLRSAAYFAAIGTGFMFFEIVLIQKLTLMLGYPTYSLSVTLTSLLVFTGLGSFLTTRYLDRYHVALLVLAAALVVTTLFYQLAMDDIVAASLRARLGLRAVLAVLMILPLGICLGGFMPIGLAVVGAHTVHKQEYVAWGWAVNGFFSVLSSVLATVLSMTFGFDAVMYIALALYVAGIAVFRTIPPVVVR